MESHLDMFAKTRSFFKARGLPISDYGDLKISSQEFEAGGHYGIELSSMNNPKILSRALELAKEYKVKISRVIECRGIVRLPDVEIKEMVRICFSEQIGLYMAIGPRAISDIGGFVTAPNGKRIGYRLRGMENLIHAVEDVRRAIELGVRGFLIYDEGLLYLLHQMRKSGALPKNIMFKYSVHACCSNPMSAKLLEEIGADCINLIPDLDIFMVKTFRDVVRIPLDVFSDTAKAAGGFLRTYDIPKMIQYAAPLYIKCGPISQPEQNHLPTPVELEERVKQARNVVEHIERHLPQARVVSPKEKTIAIPNMQIDMQKIKIQDVAQHIGNVSVAAVSHAENAVGTNYGV